MTTKDGVLAWTANMHGQGDRGIEILPDGTVLHLTSAAQTVQRLRSLEVEPLRPRAVHVASMHVQVRAK